jgi:DHHC palmitoyltransferase
MISSMYRFWIGSSESVASASSVSGGTASASVSASAVTVPVADAVVDDDVPPPPLTRLRDAARQCQEEEERGEATETSALLAGRRTDQDEDDGLINGGATDSAMAEASTLSTSANNISNNSLHSSFRAEPLDSFFTAASTTPPSALADEEEEKFEAPQEVVYGKSTNNKHPQQPPSVEDFFFPFNNSSIQRYYRFEATPLTPIAALYKRPMTSSTSTSSFDNYANNINNSEVTGLLRRSAIVPSHGTDPSGAWILVSVGGRAGWARRSTCTIINNNGVAARSPTPDQQPLAAFTPADRFQACEAWMGNHFFLCNGRLMFGSDAPTLVFTNALILIGVILDLAVLSPRLHRLSENDIPASNNVNATTIHQWWLWQVFPLVCNSPRTIFWLVVIFSLLTMLTLWATALVEPGIIPSISSPTKPPIPNDGIPLGGPVGYRYCGTCNIFRPPRSKHCNSCNCCVSMFDHHCTYIY